MALVKSKPSTPKLDFTQNLKRATDAPLWRGATCGWRGKVFDCPQLIQIFRNSRSLYTIHSQTPSLMPLEMRKVQLSAYPNNPAALRAMRAQAK